MTIKKLYKFVSFFAFSVFIFGALVIFGWLLNTEFSPMNFHTVLGFLIAIALFQWFIYIKVRTKKLFGLPITCFLIGAFLILTCWTALKVEMENSFREDLRDYSKSINHELSTEYKALDKAIKRLFDRVDKGSYPSKKELMFDINNYLTDMPSISEISISGNTYPKNSKKTYNKCKKEKQSFFDNNTLFLCLSYFNNHAVLNVNKLIKGILNKYTFQEVMISIYFRDKEIINVGKPLRSRNQVLQERTNIMFFGKHLDMIVQPTSQYSYSEIFIITDSFLFFGFILIILLSVALQGWITSKENYNSLILEAKEKIEAEERLNKIMEASPAVMLIADTKGIIKFITKNCFSLLHYKQEALLGKNVELLVADNKRKDHINFRTKYFQNPESKIMGDRENLSALRRDGTKVPVEVSLTPIMFEGKNHVLCVIIDRILHKKLASEMKDKKLISALYDCAEVSHQEINIEKALAKCLKVLCQHEKWPIGHIYIIDEEDKKTFISSNIWYHDESIEIQKLKDVTQLTTFKVGELLPGIVLQTKKPYWISDIRNEKDFKRAAVFKSASIKGAAAIPVMVDNNVLAIIEIFDVNIRPLDNEQLYLFVFLAEQIGRLIERKEAQEVLRSSEMRNRLLLESAGEGIYGIDLQGNATFVNPAAAAILGYGVDELIGKNMHNLIHYAYPNGSEYPIADCPMYAAYQDGEVHRVNNEVLWRKDKTPVWVEYISSPLYKKNKITGAVVIFTDITKRRQAEAKIKQYSDKLKASNEALDEFAYIASHDLKEPLRGINNYSKILLEDYAEKLDDEGRYELQTLVNLSQRMSKLIDSLLHYSRFGHQDLAFEETNLNETLEEKITLLAKTIEENNASIVCAKSLPTINCDGTKIGEVFYNLILNAIKYNNSDNKIVEIQFLDKGDVYQFSVADNGIGIEKDDIPKMFKMFYRLHGRDDFGGGTGAGMTIVEKIIQRHQGKIWVESEIGKGTTIFFTIQKQRHD